MSTGKKVFLWCILPFLIVMGIAEAVWVELHRLVTEVKFHKTFIENYNRIKQIYTVDIWE